MFKRGQVGAYLGNAVWAYVGHDNTDVLVQAGKDVAPGVDDHAVAVCHAAGRMTATLGWRHDIAEVLDGTCTQQDFPMRLAGGFRESGGQDKEVDGLFSTGLTEELGKAQV